MNTSPSSALLLSEDSLIVVFCYGDSGGGYSNNGNGVEEEVDDGNGVEYPRFRVCSNTIAEHADTKASAAIVVVVVSSLMAVVSATSIAADAFIVGWFKST